MKGMFGCEMLKSDCFYVLWYFFELKKVNNDFFLY